MRGRYPFNSAWGFRRKGSGKEGLLRTEACSPKNNPTMWQDWFLGDDGIVVERFGIMKRWTGTSWIESTKITVNGW